MQNIATQIDLFVSYAREDRHTAEMLAAHLRTKGWSVWWDRSIRTGSRFSQVIEEALQSARCVLVLWSTHSISSDWVHDEAEAAKEREILFPIRIDVVKPPMGFRGIQAMDLLQWDGDPSAASFLTICSHLAATLGDPTRRTAELAKIMATEATSRWSTLAVPNAASPDMPWPYWMVRFIVADTQEALSDLIWSVGGSPPYGGVSYEEASAVYELIENFKGPGRAPEKLYAMVEQFVIGEPKAWRALESFRIFDRIASSPESFNASDLRIGGVEAVESVDEPLGTYFNLLRAQLSFKAGDCRTAKTLTCEAATVLSAFAQRDSVYVHRLKQALTNAASFSAMDGDFSLARQNAALLKRLGAEDMLGVWGRRLLSEPNLPSDFSALEQGAGDYLAAGDALSALEWYVEAARVGAKGNRDKLSGLFGAMAIALTRLENFHAAIRTYRHAIEMSQRAGDMHSLSLWCQNLGALLLEQDCESALPYVRASVYAAARVPSLRQVEAATLLLDAAVTRRPEFRADAIDVIEVAARSLTETPATPEGTASAAQLQRKRIQLLEREGTRRRAPEVQSALAAARHPGKAGNVLTDSRAQEEVKANSNAADSVSSAPATRPTARRSRKR